MEKEKHLTEEEKKKAAREYSKMYYNKNKEKIKKYRQEHKEEKKKYNAEYRKANREALNKKKSEYMRCYYKTHKENWLDFSKTQKGRANNLLSSYKHNDKKYNRGECTLTGQWIVDNIFTKTCHYCGEDDWQKLGCDRIDNALPHTPDNVVPCCKSCNDKKGTTEYQEFMRLIKKVG